MHKFLLNKAKESIKRLLSKLRAFALRHNISSKIFFWLWLSTLITRYVTVALRGVDFLNSNPSVDITLIVINRLAALIVPIYVIGYGKHIAWLKVAYVLLFIWGTIEIIGIKLIVGLFS